MSAALRPWQGRCFCGAHVAVTIGDEGATVIHLPVPFCKDATGIKTRDAAAAFVERCRAKQAERDAARERHRREGIV